MMRLIEVSSLPKALVATHVKRAESPRSVLLMLIVDKTPSAWISSRMVYLVKKIELYRVDPTKLFFSLFFFFGVKLGHFAINIFFLYVTKMQAYQQKMEKFFVSEEKKFGRIDSSESQCHLNALAR